MDSNDMESPVGEAAFARERARILAEIDRESAERRRIGILIMEEYARDIFRAFPWLESFTWAQEIGATVWTGSVAYIDRLNGFPIAPRWNYEAGSPEMHIVPDTTRMEAEGIDPSSAPAIDDEFNAAAAAVRAMLDGAFAELDEYAFEDFFGSDVSITARRLPATGGNMQVVLKAHEKGEREK